MTDIFVQYKYQIRSCNGWIHCPLLDATTYICIPVTTNFILILKRYVDWSNLENIYIPCYQTLVFFFQRLFLGVCKDIVFPKMLTVNNKTEIKRSHSTRKRNADDYLRKNRVLT